MTTDHSATHPSPDVNPSFDVRRHVVPTRIDTHVNALGGRRLARLAASALAEDRARSARMRDTAEYLVGEVLHTLHPVPELGAPTAEHAMAEEAHRATVAFTHGENALDVLRRENTPCDPRDDSGPHACVAGTGCEVPQDLALEVATIIETLDRWAAVETATETLREARSRVTAAQAELREAERVRTLTLAQQVKPERSGRERSVAAVPVRSVDAVFTELIEQARQRSSGVGPNGMRYRVRRCEPGWVLDDCRFTTRWPRSPHSARAGTVRPSASQQATGQASSSSDLYRHITGPYHARRHIRATQAAYASARERLAEAKRVLTTLAPTPTTGMAAVPKENHSSALGGDASRPAEYDRTDSGISPDEDTAGLVMPAFPYLRPSTSVAMWVRAHVDTADHAVITVLTGLTHSRAQAYARDAITLAYGLPTFFARALNGEVPFTFVEATGRLTRALPASCLPRLDAFLAGKSGAIKLDSFTKALRQEIAALGVLPERDKEIRERRNVQFFANGDGSGTLTLTGPLLETQACYRRLEGMARAIKNGTTEVFPEIPAGAQVLDDRSIGALMFDAVMGMRPTLTLHTAPTAAAGSTAALRGDGAGVRRGSWVRNLTPAETDAVLTGALDPRTLTAHGTSGTTDHSHVSHGAAHSDGEARPDGAPLPEGANSATHSDGAALPGGTNSADEPMRIVIGLPDSRRFLSQQASVNVTVPFLTLTGKADLPGTLADGSPVPASIARRFASGTRSWWRILTDPATGTPLDAKARRYRVTEDLRRTLQVKWQTCAGPGCTRPAVVCEIDHVNPFDQDDPDSGGPTVFSNLQPLCKEHHQAKTDGRIWAVNLPDGTKHWMLPYGHTWTVVSPERPIDAAHARRFTANDRTGDDACAETSTGTDTGTDSDASTDTGTGPVAGDDAALRAELEPLSDRQLLELRTRAAGEEGSASEATREALRAAKRASLARLEAQEAEDVARSALAEARRLSAECSRRMRMIRNELESRRRARRERTRTEHERARAELDRTHADRERLRPGFEPSRSDHGRPTAPTGAATEHRSGSAPDRTDGTATDSTATDGTVGGGPPDPFDSGVRFRSDDPPSF
ncbi:HNH endonuclease signature motif containing protein [Brevibacterium samyangense]|uniref:HNH nuclease domain-containing protein n=1 Tax=Brevibacterium samyangense TaxID=366888 RepID=A0ABP5F4D7_9MICO